MYHLHTPRHMSYARFAIRDKVRLRILNQCFDTGFGRVVYGAGHQAKVAVVYQRYEFGSRPMGQKCHLKNLIVTLFGLFSDIFLFDGV